MNLIFKINPILIDLGFMEIRWYSVCILTAFIIGYLLVINRSKKKGISTTIISDLCFYLVIVCILGARIYYCIFEYKRYTNIIDIFKIWEGGLAIHGGIIAGIIFIYFYTKKKKLLLLELLDIFAPALVLGQAIGRWGNFFNQEAHGPAVAKSFLENLHLPNFIVEGMNINGTYYHPTFLYESIWNVIGFIILIYLRKHKKLKTGVLTGIYFIWYSVARFFIESLRTDSLMLGPIKIAQLISLALCIVGIYLIFYKKKDTRVNRYKEKELENENRL